MEQPAPTSEISPPAERAPGSNLLGATRLALIFLISVVGMLGFKLEALFVRDPRRRLVAGADTSNRWSRRVLGLMGITLDVSGPVPPPGALLTPNHFSWLDIFAVLAASPCFFVSHDGVARWPVAGMFARGIGTIFVRRSRASRDMVEVSRAIRERLKMGLCVVVFLEGTTTSNRPMLPFKPSFVQPAIEAEAPVVPIAIRYRARRPDLNIDNDVGFWQEGQVFSKQAWRLLGLRGVACEVVFGAPFQSAGKERKALAAELQGAVKGLYESEGRS